MPISPAFASYESNILELLSQSNVSLLLGAGSSACAGLPLMKELTQKICNDLVLPKERTVRSDNDSRERELLDKLSAQYRGEGNIFVTIEDFLSELIDIEAILRRQAEHGVPSPSYSLGQEQFSRDDVDKTIRMIKQQIGFHLIQPEKNLTHHRRFVRALQSRLRAGTVMSKRPINYFILNYDTVIEDALALEQIHFVDGFVGGVTAWWDPSIFETTRPEDWGGPTEARVVKLHGSVDWVLPSFSTGPMRIRQELRNTVQLMNEEPIVIYPASSKYSEIERNPFNRLMRLFRNSIISTQSHVLVIIGYSFSDKHINIELENGLAQSNGAISLIVFWGEDELPVCLKKWLSDDFAKHITVYAKKGFYKHSVKPEVSHNEDLDWYKFEHLARLLERGV